MAQRTCSRDSQGQVDLSPFSTQYCKELEVGFDSNSTKSYISNVSSSSNERFKANMGGKGGNNGDISRDTVFNEIFDKAR